MASKVESRVVSMTFDNAQFEKKVATTKKSLKDLDEQIKFKDADKSFNNLTKAADKVSFSKLSSNVGTIGVTLEKSISLGIRALDRLKEKVLDVGENMLKGLAKPIDDAFTQIVNGGMSRATKIDRAKFKMTGLNIDWDDIYADIDYGVSGTAYGLDEAAEAAANLASTGIEFGEVFGTSSNSPMGKALLGISGLASMFDKSYSDIAGLYQVIAAAGHVTNDALSRFTERAIPVTGKLADALNTTEEEVKNMAKEGAISVEYFIDVMHKEFGEHAKDANETFEGSFANMNNALSRSGEKFAASYRENMTDVYNAIRKTIGALNGAGDKEHNLIPENLLPLVLEVDSIFRGISDRVVAMTENFQQVFIESGAWKNVIEGAADLLEGAWSIVTGIVDAFSAAKSDVIPLVEDMHGVFNSDDVKEFSKAFNGQKFSKPAREFAAMAKKFREFTQSEEFISKVVTTMTKVANIVKTIKSILGTLFGYIKQIGKAIGNTFMTVANSFDGKKKTFLDLILIGLQGVDKALKSKIFVGFIDGIVKSIEFLGVAIPKVVGWVKTGISAIKIAVNWIIDAGKAAISWIQATWAVVTSWIDSMAKKFDDWFKKLTGYSVGEVFTKVSDAIKNAWEKIKGFFTSVPGWITTTKEKFLEWVETIKGSSIGSFFETISEVVGDLWAKVKEFFSNLAQNKEVDDATEKLSPFAKIWETIKSVFSGVIKFFKAAWPVLQTVFQAIGEVVSDIFGRLADMFSNIDLGSIDLGGTLTGGGVAAGGAGLFILFKQIADIVNSLKGGVESITGKDGLFKNIAGTFGALKDTLVAYQTDLKADSIMTIAKAVAILAASLFVVALLDSGKIAAAGTAIAGLIVALKDTVESLYDVSDKGSKGADAGLKNMATSMLLLSVAVLLLAFAAARLSAIKVGDLVVGLAALHVILLEVRKTMESMAKLDDKNLNSMSLVLLMLAFAVSKLVKPVQLLGTMNIMELLQGIIALKVIMQILSDTFELLDKTSKTWTSADAMQAAVKMIKAIAISMALLVIPVKLFGAMDTSELGKGLLAVAGLIILLSVCMKLLSRETETLKGDKLKSTTNGSMQGVAAALLGMATALILLIVPLKALANIEWEEIGKLGAIIAGLLVMLALFNHFGGETVGALATAGALIGIAVALTMLIVPLKALEMISWESLGKAGAIIGGMLLAISILGIPAALGMLALAAAFLVLGAAVALIGFGLEMAALGLTTIAAVGAPAGKAMAKMIKAVAEAMPAVVESIFASGKALVTGIIGLLEGLIVSALQLVGNGIMELLNTLAKIIIGVVNLLKSLEYMLVNEGIPTLSRIVVSAIDTILAVLAEHWPSIMQSLEILLGGLLEMLVNLNPKISAWLESLIQILIDLLPKVKEFLIQLCMLIIEVTPYLAVAIMTLVAYALALLPGIVSLAVDALVNSFIALCDGIANRAQEVVDAALNMLWEIIKAVFIGVYNILVKIVNDIAELIQSIWPTVKEWFEQKWSEIKTTAKEIMDNFLEGISSMWQDIVDKVTGIWDAIVEYFTGIKETIVDWGKKIINWFKGGVDEGGDELYEAGVNAGDKLVEGAEKSLDEHSPSKEAMGIGENFGEGMVIGAEGYGDILENVGFSMGTSLADGTNNGMANLDLSNLDNYVNRLDGTTVSPTISPVVDSTSIPGLGGLFSGEGKLDVSSMWDADGGTNVLQSLSAIQENQNNDTTPSELIALREELVSLKTAMYEMFEKNTSTLIGDISPRISSLEAAMYNMQVVMDTNAVVGQITPKVDEALGRRATYKGRGN